MSFTPSSSIPFRGAFVDSTNNKTISKPSSKSASKPKHSKTKHPRFILSGSRKSPPTCTISLASANASCSNTNKLVLSPSVDLPDISINIIPFPSSPIPFPTSSTSVSEPDFPAHDRNTCAEPPRTSPIRARVSQVEFCRRRSHGRLAQSTQHRTGASVPSSNPKPPGTRKRSRKISKRLSADLRFFALIQRSVTWRLAQRGLGLELQREGDRVEPEDGGMRTDFDVQDLILVKRLRAYLLEQGCKPWSIDYDHSIPPASSNNLDMDVDSQSLLLSDVESLSSSTSPPISITGVSLAHNPTSPTSTPPHSPTDMTRLSRAKVISMSHLVASLILRHKERSTLRVRPLVNPRSSMNGAAGYSCPSSPLAVCDSMVIDA